MSVSRVTRGSPCVHIHAPARDGGLRLSLHSQGQTEAEELTAHPLGSCVCEKHWLHEDHTQGSQGITAPEHTRLALRQEHCDR